MLYFRNSNIVGHTPISENELDNHCIDEQFIKKEFSIQQFEEFKKNRKQRIINLIKKLL